MPKPQRKCIFCEGSNLSREHIWPKWASEHLPKFDDESHEERVFTFTKNTQPTSPPKHRKTNGRIWTKKIKVVCKTCNETWMSQIEQTAKTILLPMMRGEPYRLTQEDCLSISRWITLKVMVAEHNSLNTHTEVVTNREMRKKFKDNQEIPNNLLVSIARCGTPSWKAIYMRNTASISLKPFLKNRTKNIQCVTVGFGELLIQVIHTSIQEIKLNSIPSPMIATIYPSLNIINWPFSNPMTDEQAFNFSMNLENMINAPNVRWLA